MRPELWEDLIAKQGTRTLSLEVRGARSQEVDLGSLV